MSGKKYAKAAIRLLRARGYRLTRPRQKVLELLADAAKPLSVYAMRDELKARGDRFEPITLYRIMACLEENGLAHRLCANGAYLRCRLADANGCHHQVVCERCGASAEVENLDLKRQEHEVGRRTRFRVLAHRLEFWGLCPACATEASRREKRRNAR